MCFLAKEPSSPFYRMERGPSDGSDFDVAMALTKAQDSRMDFIQHTVERAEEYGSKKLQG
jgi:hypothetical protein